MNLTEDAKRVLKARYCRKEEEPEDVFKRVAKAVGKANGRENEYLEVLTNLDLIPNSPALRNAGYSNCNKACYVLSVEDCLISIFNALRNCGMIFKSGGGVGINFSDLREKNSEISTGGTSSGVISFMSMFNGVVEAVKQGGFRRGALMLILEYDHPEILDFIKMKLIEDKMTNCNISVLVDDDFMSKVEHGGNILLRSRQDRRKVVSKIEARDLFDIICFSAWNSGDPGMLFLNNINKDNPYTLLLRCTNPCGELPAFPGEGCALASINLSNCVKEGKIDKIKFKKLIKIGINFLLDMNKITEFEIPECYQAQYKYNRIGLGVMGFADMLIKLGIIYDSEETLKIIDYLGSTMKKISKKITPSSASRLSIAPTGTLSILSNVSPSIEPIFDRNYTRKLTGDIGNIHEIRFGEYVRVAHEISPDWHLKIQARWQRWIDGGISKTINMPNNASVAQIKDIYMKAWKWGTKGITVYRDRSKDEQVFYSKCDGESCYL